MQILDFKYLIATYQPGKRRGLWQGSWARMLYKRPKVKGSEMMIEKWDPIVIIDHKILIMLEHGKLHARHLFGKDNRCYKTDNAKSHMMNVRWELSKEWLWESIVVPWCHPHEKWGRAIPHVRRPITRVYTCPFSFIKTSHQGCTWSTRNTHNIKKSGWVWVRSSHRHNEIYI